MAGMSSTHSFCEEPSAREVRGSSSTMPEISLVEVPVSTGIDSFLQTRKASSLSSHTQFIRSHITMM